MPTGNLPDGAKKIFVAAEKSAREGTCKDRKDKEKCVNSIAWSAVKSKYKKVGDKWIPKAEVSSFSMAITKTSYDKATDTRRWRAVASDIRDDLYEDNMTLELFSDFLQRIESKEKPPEAFRSDFWDGGIPYLSVSHYPDFNGKGVPGPVDAVYVDGEELKSTGRFFNTPIGRESFKAISKDFSDNIPENERVRISIAFLDWMHRHKSNGYVFDREKSKEPICPECLLEIISGESQGKEFLKGHLVHLALTRVPVNTRTSMEVRSMTTREEDAATIITEELAEELEEEAKLEGKSEATDGNPEVVIKADEDIEVEEKREKPSDYEDDEEEDKKKKGKKEMKEDKAEVITEAPPLALDLLKEIRAAVVKEPVPFHPLDVAISELKAVYDEAIQMENVDEALMAVNEPYEALVAVIQNALMNSEPTDTVSNEANDEIAELRAFVTEQFGLLHSKMASINYRPQQVLQENQKIDGAPPLAPDRRSVHVTNELKANPLLAQSNQGTKSETPKLTAIVRNSVGLE